MHTKIPVFVGAAPAKFADPAMVLVVGWVALVKMMGRGAADCIFTGFSGEPLGHNDGQRGCGLRFLRAFQATPVGNVRFCVEGCLSWWEKVFVAVFLWASVFQPRPSRELDWSQLPSYPPPSPSGGSTSPAEKPVGHTICQVVMTPRHLQGASKGMANRWQRKRIH